MSERLSVFVNDLPVEVYRGMKVRHALIALDQDLYEACRTGRAEVRDGQGFVVGLDGALAEGVRLYVGFREKQS
jgi:hypothetical protein